MALFTDGVVFGRYSLPSDDLAGTYSSVTASSEDPEYPAEYIAAMSNTGHLNLPSRPAKLATNGPGYWELVFPTPITVHTVAPLYNNFDSGLDVTIEAGPAGSPPFFSQAITIPSRMEDGWTFSPWVSFNPVTSSIWRLMINGPNSQPPQVGRLWLTNNLRDLSRDVQWGAVDEEDWGFIEDRTELGIATLYDLGGKERGWAGQFGLTDAQTNVLRDLYRTARGRIQPWLLIPDPQVNDAWIVRFEENGHFERRLDNPDHNIIPFRVRELSRGLPWP